VWSKGCVRDGRIQSLESTSILGRSWLGGDELQTSASTLDRSGHPPQLRPAGHMSRTTSVHTQGRFSAVTLGEDAETCLPALTPEALAFCLILLILLKFARHVPTLRSFLVCSQICWTCLLLFYPGHPFLFLRVFSFLVVSLFPSTRHVFNCLSCNSRCIVVHSEQIPFLASLSRLQLPGWPQISVRAQTRSVAGTHRRLELELP
jgi:hypothetical protein